MKVPGGQMHDNGAGATRDQVLEELRSARKLIVVTHENVDGDALGSLIAMQEVLTAEGRDSLMFIDAGEFPLPDEYGFFTLSGLVQAPPDDLAERAPTSSTSTTTTTTPGSARSTTCSRRPRARPRSCGT